MAYFYETSKIKDGSLQFDQILFYFKSILVAYEGKMIKARLCAIVQILLDPAVL